MLWACSDIFQGGSRHEETVGTDPGGADAAGLHRRAGGRGGVSRGRGRHRLRRRGRLYLRLLDAHRGASGRAQRADPGPVRLSRLDHGDLQREAAPDRQGRLGQQCDRADQLLHRAGRHPVPVHPAPGFRGHPHGQRPVRHLERPRPGGPDRQAVEPGHHQLHDHQRQCVRRVHRPFRAPSLPVLQQARPGGGRHRLGDHL